MRKSVLVILFGLYLVLGAKESYAKEIHTNGGMRSKRNAKTESIGEVENKGVDLVSHREKEELSIQLKVKRQEMVRLELETIYQNPGYPNGCEAVALNNLLRYHGYEISNEELINEYLPQGPLHESNPMKVYMGKPEEETGGYGCWAPVIVETAEQYFQKQGIADCQVKNITGSSAERLYGYVENGMPVEVWVTLKMQDSEWFKAGVVEDGREIYWPAKAHAMILIGYDLGQRIVEVNDPIEGRGVYPMDVFERVYESMGANAVVLIKSE